MANNKGRMRNGQFFVRLVCFANNRKQKNPGHIPGFLSVTSGLVITRQILVFCNKVGEMLLRRAGLRLGVQL